MKLRQSSIRVIGGNKLSGTVTASGAKNAILPILASTIMLDGETTLGNIPHLADVKSMIRMLNSLNVRTEYGIYDNVTCLNSKKIRHIAPYELVTAMRASFFVAGPLMAKTGFAKVPLPGGCSIGLRPVNIHIEGFKKMGAEVEFEHGFIELTAQSLRGNRIHLAFPSVGATENIMMAACLAEGETVIENAACEPEINDLAAFLKQAGAIIEGVGTPTIHVQGVQSLSGVEGYNVMPDRIEIGTYLIAAAISGGDITVTQTDQTSNEALIECLKKVGLNIEQTPEGIRCQSTGELKGVDVTTEPYPGFPTDMQAQLMALLCVADGKSVVKEAIFENRFMHAHELRRMGAYIDIDGQIAIVHGGRLSGADVKMTDLRAGAAMVLAGLVADGHTDIYGLDHLERGYYKLVEKLNALGAEIIV